MNDSFLEELELIPKESKKTSQQLDRHITTRHATSSPLLHFSEEDERDNVVREKEHFNVITVPSIPDIKIIDSKESSLKNFKKQSDQNVKKHSVNVKSSEKIEKIADNKGKSIDMKIKMDYNQQSVSGEHKIKLHETKYLKPPENKDRKRRSGSHKEIIYSRNTSSKENKRSLDSSNNNSSDTSSKENSRPSDSSKEASSRNPTKEKEKLANNSRKSNFKIQDQDPVVLLTAIKELISTYTKQESTKILRAMQELHINSQATLIKNLLYQTDDLVKEMHPSKDSARMKALIEENEQLQQELMGLRLRNENLQNKLEELEFLKQENAILKSKYNELTQT